MTTEAHFEPLQRPEPAKHNRGFTLTEIAIVLGIIGLILGAIWTAAAAVYNNQRISHANTAVLQMVQAIRGLYATSSNDTGMTLDNLMCAKVTPADLTNAVPCTGAGTMYDMWPGGTTVILPTTDGEGFGIGMSNIPQSACVSLLVALGGQTRDPGMFFIGTAGGGVVPATGATSGAYTTDGTALTGPVTPANALTACTSATANTVQIGFSLKS